MRQQQQRSRNRNRGRKSSNPLSRNFESNGPDVKIRGNASHIAEKYNVLARDALTSGDTVMAENYFQHAEHYFRIIAANQQNNPQSNSQNNSNRDNERSSNNAQSGEANNRDSADASESVQGEGPQPDLNIAAVENDQKNDKAAVRDLAVDRDEDTNVSEKAAKPAANRNRRNGRKPANTRRSGNNGADSEEETSSTKSTPEGLSKDAALLPSSLIGTVDENSSEKSTTQSDD